MLVVVVVAVVVVVDLYSGHKHGPFSHAVDDKVDHFSSYCCWWW